jgi:hypothetical protein
MKKTAVQWLEDNLIGNPFSEKDFAHNVNVFKQAKEMEKHQLIDAHISGYEYHEQSEKFVAGYNYFEKTYEEPYEKP